MSMSIPVRAYVFPNGMMMVFDENGQQVPEFQGYTAECLPKLRAVSDCEVIAAKWDGRRDNPIVVEGEV